MTDIEREAREIDALRRARAEADAELAVMRSALEGLYAVACAMQYEPGTGEPPVLKDGIKDQWMRRANEALSSTPRAKAVADVVTALGNIVAAYDAYRGKGVMPAPDAYRALVESIVAGTDTLARLTDSAPPT